VKNNPLKKRERGGYQGFEEIVGGEKIIGIMRRLRKRA